MPLKIPDSIIKYLDNRFTTEEMALQACKSYKSLSIDVPQISIVIPAYNEASNIVMSLASLCSNKTSKSVEIIVVDNNSTDDTKILVNACGVRCIGEAKQGITHARNAGLRVARGTYILNADADAIYPEDWIEEMTKPLILNFGVAMTYGRFSFIPIADTGRSIYFVYEYFSAMSRWYNKMFKDEAVNVYGFNSAFRKDQGLQVDGFNHPPGTNEDGYLALKLRSKGFGRLHCVKLKNALVWTTDRRIQIDGGLSKAIVLRLKRVFS
jgi:glycosyltransferase involved in cell wall biosynthesis